MKVNPSDEDHDSVIIAMEVGYQALADLASYYKEVNDQLLKQIAIWEGKSVKEIKKEVNFTLRTNGKEKDLLAKIKASQEVIKRYNLSKKDE
jgi:CO dehydrogenase nickel-insertion accessory protein CooC1